MLRQRVYTSRTRTGVRGLFTGRFMVMPLPDRVRTPEQIKEYAEALDFELVEEKDVQGPARTPSTTPLTRRLP